MRGNTFTTYINAATDPAFERAFQKGADSATKAFGIITREANKASAATAGLLGGRGSGGLGQSRALDSTTAAAAAASRATAKLANDTRRTTTETAKLTKESNALATSLRTTAQTLNIVQGPLGPLAGRVAAVATAVEQLTGFRLGIAALGASIFALGRSANQFAEIESQLRPLYDTQSQLNSAMNDVVGIANRSRTALAPVLDLYKRLTSAGAELGISQQRAGRLTELAAKAARLSGGASQSQEAGLGQFLQAFGSNNFGGEELKSIKENTFELAKAIAQGLPKEINGGVEVAIGDLKRLGAEGKLTSEVVAAALEKSGIRIEQAYAKLPALLSSSGRNFGTAFLVQVGRADQAVGATSKLAGIIDVVAENLNKVIGLAIGAGAAFVALKATRLVKDFRDGLVAAKAVGVVAESLRTGALSRANAEQFDAKQAQERSARRIAALKAERDGIMANIAALKAKGQAEAATAVAARAAPGGAVLRRTGPGAAGVQLVTEAAATRAMVKSTEDLTRARARLRAVDRGLRDNNVALVSANVQLRDAMKSVAAAGAVTTQRFALLRQAGAGILSIFGGGLGFAITALTTGLYLLATAESAAEKATRRNEESQRAFASAVDQATGKIREQIGEIEKLDLVKNQQGNTRFATGRFTFQKQNLTRELERLALDPSQQAGLARGRTVVKSPAEQQLAEAIAKFKNNGSSLLEFEKKIKDLSPSIPRLKTALDEAGGLTERFKNLGAALDTATREAAQGRILAGKSRPGDLAVASGEVTQRAAAGQKTKAQLDAEARVLALSLSANPLKKAQGDRDTKLAALEKERATLAPDEYVRQRVEILQSYDLEQAAIRKTATEARRAIADQRAAESAAQRQKRQEDAAAARSSIEEGVSQKLQGLEERAPGLSRQSYLDERLRILETYDDEINALSETDRLSDRAGKQRLADLREVSQVMSDVLGKEEEQQHFAALRLEGRHNEAAALEQTLEYVDRIGDQGYTLYGTILKRLEAEERINDALASQERITSLIQGTVDVARNSFEQLLLDLPTRGPRAAGDFIKSMQDQLFRISARTITEKLFAGADDKVRALISGRGGVESAQAHLAGQMNAAATSSQSLALALDAAAATITSTAGALTGGSALGAPAAGGEAGVFGVIVAASTKVLADGIKGKAPAAAGKGTASGEKLSVLEATFQQVGTNLDAFVAKVQAKRKKDPGDTKQRVKEAADATGSEFFKKIGKSVGTALDGSAQGQFASNVAKSLGIKQSATGAKIGGAIGALTGIPGGGFIGGLIGGTLGGALKKTKSGAATITTSAGGGLEVGTAFGNSAARQKAATGLAGQVTDSIDQIAQTLGAKITGASNITIGQYGDKYRVNTSGTSLKTKKGAVDFGDDAQAAIEYAVRFALENAVVSGISAASVRIIKSGQDLEKAIGKAAIIESIPRRLLARTDPVRYAVEELNKEFERTIAVLKEGAATAEQFSDAQKLYELERADAIERATQQAGSAIDQFLKDMVGSSASPLSKAETFSNAKAELGKFESDILAGKRVDLDPVLAAGRNFQDASRALKGSSAGFFSDFDYLRDLLTRARDNAGITNVTSLPTSPFTTDVDVQKAISLAGTAQVDAVNSQTEVLADRLDRLISAVGDLAAANGGQIDIGAINALPGFGFR